MITFAAVLAAATGGTVAAPPANAASVAVFGVGGVDLALPLPAGYCLPTSTKQRAAAQLLAAADTINVTHLTLVRCNGDQKSADQDYSVIKTPRSALMVTLDRPTLVAAMGEAFKSPVTLAKLDFGKVSDDVSAVFGKPVDLSGAIKPLGHDETCAYLGGSVDVKVGTSAYAQSVGGCITSTASRIIVVYRYGADGTPAGIVKLLSEAKVLAESIKG